MGSMSEHPTGLDDPEYATFAWRRYRRMLGWMTLFSRSVVRDLIALVRKQPLQAD